VTLAVRDNDARECRAAGYEPEEALRLSIQRSDEVYEARAPNGELMALWGIRTSGFLTTSADVWLLSSNAVFDWPLAFGRESRRISSALMETYSILRVEVHARYFEAVKWLQWLGFSVVSTRRVGDEIFALMQKDRG
jgi:hypothetical protein